MYQSSLARTILIIALSGFESISDLVDFRPYKQNKQYVLQLGIGTDISPIDLFVVHYGIWASMSLHNYFRFTPVVLLRRRE